MVVAIGSEDEILRRYRARMYIDASGYIATLGLIDPSYLLYSGPREDERKLILSGIFYTEILAMGGGS